MKNRSFWKTHYVVETDVAAIERCLRVTSLASEGKNYDLVYCSAAPHAPCIVIS